MAAITICSDFGAQKNKVSHCFPIYLPWNGGTGCHDLSLMMYSTYKLNEQGDNIQPWHTPFLIWNQSVVPCPILTAASWPGYRFLRRQVRWSVIPISLRIFLSLLWSTQSKALAYSVWLDFCDCGFHSLWPLMDKDKRLMEAFWLERLTVEGTRSCSDGQGHAQ